jgi:D-lactate dehydrogenase
VLCRILAGFGCRVLAHDLQPSNEARALGVRYVSVEELWPASDIVSLHLPLTPRTHHLMRP